MVVHGYGESWISHDRQNGDCDADTTKVRSAAAIQSNKMLVSAFNMVHVTAFGLCGCDGNLLQLRSKKERSNGVPEIAGVTSFWLDAITEKGGVPVIASVGIDFDGNWRKLDADRLAIRCAVAWNADLLMYLVDEDGVKAGDGGVMRWLDAGNLDQIDRNSLGAKMMARLNGCREALEGGVRRARIYPYSHIESLSDFYSTRLDYGTEVTTAIPPKYLPSWSWSNS